MRTSTWATNLRAVRCAFWVGTNLALRGEMGPATGWLGRARRLLERQQGECVERGYLLLPLVFQHEATGDYEAASATVAEAAAIGERFADADLFALAVHEHGNILIRRGRVREGLGLLDEAMVAVTAGELSPLVAGLVYCGVILACQEVYEVRRAGVRLAQATNVWAAAQASYRLGEVHRLQGEFDAAEAAYREANRLGYEPQPGLALLRLAQGSGAAAAVAIRRVMGKTGERLKRAGLLPAYVQITLAVAGRRQRAAWCLAGVA
jgi:tetratricopeptide (TPR) repeat protein